MISGISTLEVREANTLVSEGAGEVRDSQVLADLVNEPFRLNGEGYDIYGTLFLKAAVLAYGIARECPFTEANGETAWLATAIFLGHNGRDIGRLDSLSEYGPFILSLAREEISLHEAAAYLARHIID